MNFLATSRRDDLKSLCYLLIYMFRNTDVEYIARGKNLSRKQVFNQIKDIKMKLTPESLVGKKGTNTYQLLPFVKDIFKLKFAEAPNY